MEKLEGSTCGASLGWGRAEGQRKLKKEEKKEGNAALQYLGLQRGGERGDGIQSTYCQTEHVTAAQRGLAGPCAGCSGPAEGLAGLATGLLMTPRRFQNPTRNVSHQGSLSGSRTGSQQNLASGGGGPASADPFDLIGQKPKK